MSGVKPGAGPERPKEETTEVPALYKESGFQHGNLPKILIIVAICVIGLMLVLALIFCLVGGIQHKQPRYFLLIINLILSTAITGLLIFWYFRGTLMSSMLWYIFLQCLFLFFQCITTDIFAWYETQTAKTPTVPWHPINPNCSNATNCSNSTHPNSTYQGLVDLFHLN